MKKIISRILSVAMLFVMLFSMSVYGAEGREKIRFDKSKYTHIWVGDGDYVAVSKDGKNFGYVDFSGRVVLPLEYKVATRFVNGKAAIIKDNNVEFINGDLEIVETFKNAEQWEYLFASGGFNYLALAYSKDSEHKASPWAREYAVVADEMGIVSKELKEKYKSNINREEFAEILVNNLINKSVDFNYNNTDKLFSIIDGAFANKEELIFEDTNSEYVKIAYNLGIVEGRSKKVFDPKAEISRQEAAVMLMRAYKLIQDKTILDKTPEYKLEKIKEEYNDNDLVADWAKQDVFFARHTDLMVGVGGKKFDPLGTFTVEQSITTMIRLYNELK